MTIDINILLRRLLPLICAGVLLNVGISWYLSERGQAVVWPELSWQYILPAALLALLPWFWHGVRLAIWGRFFGVRISALNLLRIAVATDVGGVVMPQAVGGAPVKMAMLVQQGYKPGQAATLALLGNFEDVVFYALLIPTSLLLSHPGENPLWQYAAVFLEKYSYPILLFLAVAAGGYWVLKKYVVRRRSADENKPSRWRTLASEFRAAARMVRQKGHKPFLLSLLAMAAQWLTRFAILPAVLLAMGFSGDLMPFFLLQWMVFVAMTLVPTPGATGGAEAAFLMVFGKIIPAAAVVPALSGWRFLTYYFVLLAGVGILWATGKIAAANSLSETPEADLAP